MELMKRLEGEVLEALVDLGGQEAFAGLEGHTVDPHQFLGMELNPRAAAIAELVLWIGYLQWHFRTRGGAPSEPILKAFKNIEVKNAVLTWDGYPFPQMRDNRETYPNPRRPTWPTAEFIVGNPPFIGGKDLRARLGDVYTEALWAAHKHVNDSADFVMYWWDRAAEILTAKGSPLRRFGFVTTNSITQEFSRRVIKKRMEAKTPVSLLMAIPDHPWTKATRDAAAVRIAMTVVIKGAHEGELRESIPDRESKLDTDQPVVEFVARKGLINSDLSIGADVTTATKLRANEGICSPGVKLHGDGFIVTPEEAEHLGLGRRPGLERHIRHYRNGRDLTRRPRGVMVIDLFGLSSDEVRLRFPEVYQHVVLEVKEKKDADGNVIGRDSNNRAYRRENWWLFGENNPDLRKALSDLDRYIATVETTKHRTFQFLDRSILPDNMLTAIASADAFHLGVLSSRVHVVWTLWGGGTLEDRPRYTKTLCFDPFPFPIADDFQKQHIRDTAEELDAHRKRVLTEHPHLTLTDLYNVLEQLQSGATPSDLGAKERRVFDDGLVLILKELHDRLDQLVFETYRWPADLSNEEILNRLVALNKERSTEEKRGLVRWLRPEYQILRFGREADKQAAAEEGAQVSATLHVLETKQKPSFPSDSIGQTAAVMTALAEASGPTNAAAIASTFKQGKRIEAKVQAVLDALSRMSFVVAFNGGFASRQRRET
jgi:hypothetical protein